VSREAFAQRLILLPHEGWSIRALCRHFGTSRNAVRRILRTHAHHREQGHEILQKRLRRGSKLDAFAPAIQKILERYPTITAVRLHEKLGERGYARGGSRSSAGGWRRCAPGRTRSSGSKRPAGCRGNRTGAPPRSPLPAPARPRSSASPTSWASPGGGPSTSRPGGTSSPSSAGTRTPSSTTGACRRSASTTARRRWSSGGRRASPSSIQPSRPS